MRHKWSPPAALTELIRSMMVQKGLNNSSLARQIGVTEGAIRHFLQPAGQGSGTLDPFSLRAVAEVLELDQVQLFQLAGYIDAGYEPVSLSIDAHYVGLCFDDLSPEKQNLLMNLLHTLKSDLSEPRSQEHQRSLLTQVWQLRREHPALLQRNFGLRDEFGRFVGSASRTTTSKVLLPILYKRLIGLFVQEPEGSQPLTEDFVQRVTDHPDVAFVLEQLQPRKAIPTALEKLHWLLYTAENVDTPENKLKPADQQAYRALWRLLVHIAEQG